MSKSINEAVIEACGLVQIEPPKNIHIGRWIQTRAMTSRDGKGDGRVLIAPDRVVARNWQIDETKVVFLDQRSGDRPSAEEKRDTAERLAKQRKEDDERARKAAQLASMLMVKASQSEHPYLHSKGFRDRQVMTVEAAILRDQGLSYLAPDDGKKAIILPVKIKGAITSAQLIWEDGTKKFLAGGRIKGGSLPISNGGRTWLCEGFATALTALSALRAMHRSDAVVVCFSASNIVEVARSTNGECIVVADNDKPQEVFNGLGAGEHFARLTRRPHIMPGTVGCDLNDLYVNEGIYAVQRLLAAKAKAPV